MQITMEIGINIDRNDDPVTLETSGNEQDLSTWCSSTHKNHTVKYF